MTNLTTNATGYVSMELPKDEITLLKDEIKALKILIDELRSRPQTIIHNHYNYSEPNKQIERCIPPNMPRSNFWW